jgi:hypothetical protein
MFQRSKCATHDVRALNRAALLIAGEFTATSGFHPLPAGELRVQSPPFLPAPDAILVGF